MRTTIRIEDNLLRQAKLRAAATGRTVGEIVEDALRVALSVPREAPRALAPLPVHGGGGVLPGVDLGDTAALLDLMDEERPLDARR